jgi:putative spermidine/putrescine transport system substrate-binding protein
MQSFQQDCVDLAMRKYRRGEVGRRTLLAGLAALGAVPLTGGGARAQAQRQLVMVNWGGIANEGFGRFYGQPFMEANAGVRVVQDSTGPSAGRIRSMVESGRVTWDLCDSSASSSVVLGRQNLVQRVDYSIVNRSTSSAGFALEWGAAPYSFSSVLAYDSAKFPNGEPKSWADFFDLRRFPARA